MRTVRNIGWFIGFELGRDGLGWWAEIGLGPFSIELGAWPTPDPEVVEVHASHCECGSCEISLGPPDIFSEELERRIRQINKGAGEGPEVFRGSGKWFPRLEP